MSFRNPYAAYQRQAQLMNKTKEQVSQPKAQPTTPNILTSQAKQPIQPQNVSQQIAMQYQKPVRSQQNNSRQAVKQPGQPSQPPKVSHQAVSQPQTSSQSQQAGNNYLTNTIMTAAPEELTLLLYQGAIKFMKQTIIQIEAKNISETNRLNQRAQAIFSELMCSLDMDQEISHQLFNIYQFIIDSLIEANIKKDPALVSQMIEFTTELCTTWQEAIKLAKQQKVI